MSIPDRQPTTRLLRESAERPIIMESCYVIPYRVQPDGKFEFAALETKEGSKLKLIGGQKDASDVDCLAAVVREGQEEMDISLEPNRLGQFGDSISYEFMPTDEFPIEGSVKATGFCYAPQTSEFDLLELEPEFSRLSWVDGQTLGERQKYIGMRYAIGLWIPLIIQLSLADNT